LGAVVVSNPLAIPIPTKLLIKVAVIENFPNIKPDATPKFLRKSLKVILTTGY
jgi:hypothetical protein